MTVAIEQSPLDYHGDHPDRVSIYEEGAGIGADSYFAIPDLVAFLDWSPQEDGAFIFYMATRPGFEGNGLARVLVQYLYDTVPGEINWGHIMSDRAEKLWHSFRKKYPTRSRGKVR